MNAAITAGMALHLRHEVSEGEFAMADGSLNATGIARDDIAPTVEDAIGDGMYEIRTLLVDNGEEEPDFLYYVPDTLRTAEGRAAERAAIDERYAYWTAFEPMDIDERQLVTWHIRTLTERSLLLNKASGYHDKYAKSETRITLYAREDDEAAVVAKAIFAEDDEVSFPLTAKDLPDDVYDIFAEALIRHWLIANPERPVDEMMGEDADNVMSDWTPDEAAAASARFGKRYEEVQAEAAEHSLAMKEAGKYGPQQTAKQVADTFYTRQAKARENGRKDANYLYDPATTSPLFIRKRNGELHIMPPSEQGKWKPKTWVKDHDYAVDYLARWNKWAKEQPKATLVTRMKWAPTNAEITDKLSREYTNAICRETLEIHDMLDAIDDAKKEVWREIRDLPMTHGIQYTAW